ncbi:DUF7660 family protein [Pseudomonas eucalypticola]|uniref:DUF7660 family protein n=1 Tax=Pseudomonas eucalypticola TaxID=2599595 RepID=UPI003CC85F6E
MILNFDDWGNAGLKRFLAAMEAWIRSMDRYVINSGDIDVASRGWSIFAKILCASKIYEWLFCIGFTQNQSRFFVRRSSGW